MPCVPVGTGEQYEMQSNDILLFTVSLYMYNYVSVFKYHCTGNEEQLYRKVAKLYEKSGSDSQITSAPIRVQYS